MPLLLLFTAWATAVSPALTATAAADTYTAAALADEVTRLPGTAGLHVPFRHFSGYLTVPGHGGGGSKHLHYWFVESTKRPATDPVAFWTNGGPGCSGLIGFFTEQGPFKATANGSVLTLNAYAWNAVANMVFIESPVGVGFSFSAYPEDYRSGDASVARDNYALIQAFYVRFPQYRSNPMYISSESYGGHYLPTLAKVIVDENHTPSSAAHVPLPFKGLAVGNPYTDAYSGTGAMIDTMWGHQLVAKPVYEAYRNACYVHTPVDVDACDRLTESVFVGIGILNYYALDFPICLSYSAPGNADGRRQGDELTRGRLSMAVNTRGGVRATPPQRPAAGAPRRSAQRLWLLRHLLRRDVLGEVLQADAVAAAAAASSATAGTAVGYEPCGDDYTTAYLNQPAVKAALHVNTSITWVECSDSVVYSNDEADRSTVPIFKELIDRGDLDVLVYSGDDDSVCATIGTQNWVWGLGYPVDGSDRWREYIVGGQVAGYLTRFQGHRFALLTVHGAGHEVPTYRPVEALDMWTRYLDGEFTNG
jgi:carboxypeptidase C (cathepsin A)